LKTAFLLIHLPIDAADHRKILENEERRLLEFLELRT